MTIELHRVSLKKDVLNFYGTYLTAIMFCSVEFVNILFIIATLLSVKT